MEEILKQLLEGQKQLFEGQQQLFEGQKQLFDVQEQLFNGQGSLKEELSQVKSTVNGIKLQLTETNQLVRAIEHRTEELNAEVSNIGLTLAKIEGQLSKTATKDDIIILDSKFEVLNSRLFHQEAELYSLKKAQ